MAAARREQLKLSRTPSREELMLIPLAQSGEYEIPDDKEVASTRREIYRINKDAIRRYRTMREWPMLYVWRIK